MIFLSSLVNKPAHMCRYYSFISHVLSPWCTKYTLEADSVLPRGLPDCEERGGDHGQHFCQAQWKQWGMSVKSKRERAKNMSDVKRHSEDLIVTLLI